MFSTTEKRFFQGAEREKSSKNPDNIFYKQKHNIIPSNQATVTHTLT
jgi:hypothetical protein